jgi:hypothetical protein
MAKEKPADDYPKDTTLHARTMETGKYGDQKDILYVPGEGFYLSKHATHDLERDMDAQAKKHDDPTSRFDSERCHRLFISESVVSYYNSVINTTKEMEDARERARKEYERTCYEGTDTQDPLKRKDSIHTKQNEFELDRSQSTILLSTTTATGGQWLNGSAVQHRHAVHISITSPDGRDLCDVSMTFDQFASFLVSNMATPCTVGHYWSINDQCLRLSEVVKPPEDISSRMEQRLRDRLVEMEGRMTAIQTELETQIASGKAMSKTKVAELLKQLRWFMGMLQSNRDFTVEQAREEVASIVEQAACEVAWQHKLDPHEVVSNPQVQALAKAYLNAKIALPAHQENK